MSFGKNRVQFNDFVWKRLKFNRYDVYYNQDGAPVAQYVAKKMTSELLSLEELFNYSFDKRLVIIVYNKMTDFRQTNIGMVTGMTEYNLGGVSKIINNKLVLFFEGDYQLLDIQIRNALCQVFADEILYGKTIGNQIMGTAEYTIPLWYYHGLLSYMANNWDLETETKVLHLFSNNQLKKVAELKGEDARIAGHSFWFFMQQAYGTSVLSDILFLTHFYKDAVKALLQVTGYEMDDLIDKWLLFIKDNFSFPVKPESKLTQKFTSFKRKDIISKIRLSPDGNYIAWVKNNKGEYSVNVQKLKGKRRKKVFKGGYKVVRETDYSFPVIAWSPDSEILSFMSEEKGGIKLGFYDLTTKEHFERNFLYFEKVLSYSYSSDGFYFIMSAIKNGQSDLFLYHIPSAIFTQLTNDKAGDYNPRFTPDGKSVLFVSDREIAEGSSIKFGLTKDLFLFRFDKTPQIISVLDINHSQELNPLPLSNNNFLFARNSHGNKFLYTVHFDSTISFIDTAIHYRYFSDLKQLEFNSSFETYDFNAESQKMAFVSDDGNRNLLAISKVDTTGKRVEPNSEHTYTGNYLQKKYYETDSLRNLKIQPMMLDSLISDTLQVYKELEPETKVNISNYIFEVEKLNSLYFHKYNTYIDIKSKKRRFKLPDIRIYETSFYNNYLVSQIDLGFLSNSYQAYTGKATYYNPGINGLLKIGANDLFEDYRIIGGVSFSADFMSNEFLISLEDLKKQIDKQYVFHRMSFSDTLSDEDRIFMYKTVSHQFIYALSYPFSEIRAVKLSMSLREDKLGYLATDLEALRRGDDVRYWATAKLEYIFDNTMSPQVNIFKGTRFKIFAESFLQLDDLKNDLHVLGCDFRNYQSLYRNIIFASRFAASTSFGNSRLVYFLGGVDSWTRLMNQTFDYSIPVNERERYAYQANATNMRGFLQNIRNGNNFAVINAELRVPMVSTLFNYPSGYSIIDNFQLVSFFDVGSAWSGLSPYSGRNAWDSHTIQQGPVTVSIDSNRDPIVYGYGLGLRTQLFGYFMRFDWAWGIENRVILPRVFYFSLSLDF